MITVENFRDILTSMGFTPNVQGIVFAYEGDGFSLSADFANQKLIYPAKVRGKEHNNSFAAPENFVVFECVCRLLMKGYRSEDIELEKAWQLGHTPKSGRADICVYERDSEKVLMIIECKTWGREFDIALKNTLADGAQLFSYWQQESSAKWLVLYTSDIKDGNIVYKSPAVNCIDDSNVLLQAKNDESIKLYANAYSAVEKFTVWHDTYNHELHDDVIFSPLSQPYNVGISPLRKKDLVPFEGQEGIVNKFEEILRHNNVSDKENAFNRLIALFICKLVDELTKEEDAEVDFQYRPRADSYENLQDRLQHLYTQGMREFMREEITYIPADYPEQLFSNYTGKNRSKAIEELTSAFRKLKYFTNNDFAFKDVHNETLFYQNGKVLVEVVQLFQRYRIVHASSPQSPQSKEQFLGDMFEQLLDKGFKQNEGQFFTPRPLTRFIWDSLPLRRYSNYPKVIDYACGAGHFLTEAVAAINYFLNSENNHWVRDCIFGIEKDYRLARVSKVAMFMNEAGESNIVFGDGLENSDLITPEKFDILTANPPYSVASFKQHLRLKKNVLTLLDTIGDAGSEIEVLFVERIAQLLKSSGIAAVILPSSILSSGADSYTKAREEILSKFKVRAIVRLSNKTFQETGTNTVILFLERYAYPPERSSHVIDSVNAILGGQDLRDWEDEEILNGYLELQGLTSEEWGMCVQRSPMLEDLPEYFRNYLDAFGVRKDVKKLRPEEYSRRFWEYVRGAEGEKLFYYGMMYSQRTVVILAPSDNAGQREFLGYDWSSRKGAEGIQYVEPRGGKMYVNDNREAEGTLAHIVRQSFSEGEIVISEDKAKYARVVKTSDMLDFSRVGFDAAIRLQESKVIIIESKYSLVKMSSLCTINIPKSEAKGYPADTLASFLDMASVSSEGKIIVKTDRPISELWTGSYSFFREGDIICAKMMSSAENMKCVIANGLTNGIGFGSSEFYTFRCEKRVLTRYLCEFLNLPAIREAAWASVTGTGRLRVPSSFYETMLVPLPPMDIQQKIVNDCLAVDEQAASLNAQISSCHDRIEALFHEVEAQPSVSRLAFDDKRAFTLAIGKRVLNSELIPNGKIPVFSANVLEPFGYVNKLLKGFEDFTSASVMWGIDGDFMVSFLPQNIPFYPTDHCGVLRVLTEKVHPRYAARILEREGRSLGFSRSNRASLDRVGRITFSVPNIEVQARAMTEVLRLEEEIAQAKIELEGLSGKKAAILNMYL